MTTETIDIHGVYPRSEDSVQLQALVQMLVGQPFQFIRFAYGKDMRVHLGELRRGPLSDLWSGSYVVATRGSRWDVRQSLRSDVRPDKDSVVVVASVLNHGDGYQLWLVFGNGVEFTVNPTAGKSAEENSELVADWEILTPHDRLLRVGPGRVWSYTDSTG